MSKKEIALTCLGLFIAIFSMIGVSYAVWEITLTQEDEDVITSDCFDVRFTESNILNLTNAIPLDGKNLEAFLSDTKPYHFTVKNACTSKASAVIQIEVLNADAGKSVLDDQYLDLVLYDGSYTLTMNDLTSDTSSQNIYSKPGEGKTGYKLNNYPTTDNKQIKEATKAYQLYNFTLESQETKEFNLIVFLDKDATADETNIMNHEWKGEITVNTSYVPEKEVEEGS